jgi:xylulokinase
LVAGVDSSTQSCKVLICDADTGAVVRQASAPHPDATEVHPNHWWTALGRAVADAGGLDDVVAISVGAQQHGMVCLDDTGAVVRDALLWNDTRSAGAALDLVDELPGGAAEWAIRTGSVPLASFTVAKLRWLAEHEPANAARTAAVCLPHDWLTARLRGGRNSADAVSLEQLSTDRGDASGTGYWSPAENRYRPELLELALGAQPTTPRVVAPAEAVGAHGAALLGPGTGDNAASALGTGAQPGDVIVSIGTSGVVCAVSERPTADENGIIAGFADATGHYLPLVCTLNAAPVLEAVARMLRVSLTELSDLARSAPPGADGLVVVGYLEGERTPNRPYATGAVHGMTLANTTPAHLARAAVEGLLCGLADGLDALRAHGVSAQRAVLVGGGARSAALREIAPAILGVPVVVPPTAEYVARGAARQAAWVLTGAEHPPAWPHAGGTTFDADARPSIRERYHEVSDLTARRLSR